MGGGGKKGERGEGGGRREREGGRRESGGREGGRRESGGWRKRKSFGHCCIRIHTLLITD